MAKPQLVAKKNLIVNGEIVFAGSDVPEGVPQHLLENWAEQGAVEFAPVMVDDAIHDAILGDGWEEPVREATPEEVEWAKQQASTVWPDKSEGQILGDLEAAKQQLIAEEAAPAASVESVEAPVVPVEAPVVATPKPTNKKRN